MEYEEVKKLVSDLVANPDTAQISAVSLLEKIKGDYETLDSLRAEKDKTDERIRTLQDTNQRLFLMTTGKVEEEKEELNGIEAVDNFISDLMKEG